MHDSQHGLQQPVGEVYLLFAHEAYFPWAGAQEVNTSVVAAASLLHPHVLQPDGMRIYDRLTRGRRLKEIVPLATLTYELGGGASWPQVGDWETVTRDLLQLISGGGCDALSLNLPTRARTLVCCGPHSTVRAYDLGPGEYRTYEPTDRIEVLLSIGQELTRVEAGCALRPGDNLVSR
ncbi:hypothetical protein ACFVU0_13810 [Streptomyces sp. NPDC058122]|uniref:hypothetical protein n=1 Tax=Streptomyces sp. NPDC058122 TaxID=3346349 RepID=UPI0036E1A748